MFCCYLRKHATQTKIAVSFFEYFCLSIYFLLLTRLPFYESVDFFLLFTFCFGKHLYLFTRGQSAKAWFIEWALQPLTLINHRVDRCYKLMQEKTKINPNQVVEVKKTQSVEVGQGTTHSNLGLFQTINLGFVWFARDYYRKKIYQVFINEF